MITLAADTVVRAATTPAPQLEFDAVVSPYMSVFFVAFLVAFAATPLMRYMAMKNGIVDWPDLKRKSHIEPVAYLGGVALFLGWAAGVAMCLIVAPHNAKLTDFIFVSHVSFPMSILVGAAIITITGLCDDVYGISPRMKVGGQLLAAAALATQDFGTKLVMHLFATGGIEVQPWLAAGLGAVIIGLLVVGGCNSVNLIDGLDGLAGGVSAIAAMGFLFIAVVVAVTPDAHRQFTNADSVRIVMCLALLGTLLGFLPYNFNPATIFMGDAGSLLLGYLCVSAILLFGNVQGMGPLLIMAAMIVFAVPIIDTSLAIFRRLMRGQSIFSPDNQHLHHMLIRAGMSVRRAVLTLYALAGFFAVLGCSLVFLRWRYVMAVFMVIFGFVLVTAYKISHRQLLRQKMAMQQHLPPAEMLGLPAAAPAAPRPRLGAAPASPVDTPESTATL